MDKSKFYDIPGYDGLYQINLNEEVKSVSRTIDWKNIKRREPEKLLSVQVDDKGYKRVKFYDKKVMYIHRILAVLFVPNPTNLPVVRHLDDNPINNNLSNLAWGTQKDNMQDSIRNGTFSYAKPREDSRYLIGNRHAKTRMILDTQTGIFYDTMKDAAIAKCHKPVTLCARLKGRIPNKTGLIYI